MENEILVSICCLTYNHENYLRDTIEGFLMQKVDFPIEILINDDASTDKTAEIVREYAAKYPTLIRAFYQPVNLYSQGKDLCLEVLYPAARGKYIALCEGDDYWTEPTKLQRQVDFLEAHPAYSACVHDTMLHYCGGEQKDRPLLNHGADCDVRFEDICNGMSYSFHTSSIVAKKAIIANPQDFFYVGLSHGFGDHPDALWLYCNGPIRCLKECMSVYRIHSGSASWSAAVDDDYDKLREFIIGKCELLRAFRPWAPKDRLDVVDRAILEKEFELMYIEGRDADQRKPPYDEILAEKPLSYRLKNHIKCLFPGIQARYRKKRGYVSEKTEELPVTPLSPENLSAGKPDAAEGAYSSDACTVSILCTAYNHEAFLRDALDGFVNQRTRFPFEVLINDDVSTDSTRDIIREYAGKYPEIIRPFYQEENLYSRGIDVYQTVFFPNARGKYVAYCEGDDYWTDPTKLQRQVDFLEAHPDYSACVHNTVLHFCTDGHREKLLHRFEGDVGFEEIISSMANAYHTSSLVARRDILANPPDFYAVASEYGFGDYPDALWLRLHGKIRYLDRCMSVYRINSNESSWSAGVAGQYGKLRRFIIGKTEMLRAFRPYAPEEVLPLVDRTIREREFELMYIEGRDAEQRKPPYDKLLRAQPLSYQVKNFIKSSLPGIQRLYRRARGYRD